MSGGRWNCQDARLDDLGSALEGERDLVLRRTGTLLRQLSDMLGLADRYLSGDSDEWLDERPKLQRIIDALPPGAGGSA